MSSNLSNEFIELFYRNCFERVIVESQTVERELTPKEQGIVANTYFELHQVEQAKKILEHATSTDFGEVAEKIFLRARLSYFDKKYQDARKYLSQITDSSDIQLRIRSLITLANIHLSESDLGSSVKCKRLIELLIEEAEDDQKICYYLLNARLTYRGLMNDKEWMFYCSEALRLAAKHGWNYWIIDALYVKACAHQQLLQEKELLATFNLLQPLVIGSGSLLKSHLIAHQFHECGLLSQGILELDRQSQRFHVRGKVVDLSRKPLVYLFALVLFEAEDYVSKEKICAKIWPDEKYNLLVHDARIFNLANRLRAEIEMYRDQPSILVSGRLGYRLATQKKDLNHFESVSQNKQPKFLEKEIP